jgi:hypothetical protein
MRSLSVETVSRESADHLCGALSAFGAEVVEKPGSIVVHVPLKGGGAELVAILNAIQDHVKARMTGTAVVELDGQSYLMDSPPS